MIAGVLLLLNTYPLLVSEDLVFRSKETTMTGSVSVMVYSLSGLNRLTQENVEAAMAVVEETGLSRILVTDSAGLVLYDTRETGGAVGKYTFYSEIVQALEGNDAFSSSYRDGAFRSRASSPVLYQNRIVGAVYAYEYDTEQAALLEGLQTNLMRLSVGIALAVVLLNVTATFANSFDMDKYVANFTASDFIVADAGQFQTGGDSFNGEMALPQALVDEIDAQGGVTEGGKVYGKTSPVEEFVTEEYYRTSKSWWYDAEQLDSMIRFKDRNEAGLLADTAQIYGMEPFALDHLRVLEGDLSKLYEPGGNYVAAVYSDNDYGEAEMDSHWAKLGSTVTLRYVEEYEYYDPDTGEVYPEDADLSQVNWASRAVKYQDVEYEVAALVTVPSALSYRYYGADEFVMNDQTFIRDTGTDGVMYYAFDTTDQDNAAMEAFLADYTGNVNPQFDYESKATYAAEFESFRSMFLLLGGVLSLIVGLVGVLNFFNAILTGIITRKREFAVIQSIGMTGRQLKTTLVYEGLLYAMGAVAAALVLTVGLSPLLGKALGSMFWFLTYRFTVVPILLVAPAFALLGVLVPLGVYRSAARRTIVERLREAEQGG